MTTPNSKASLEAPDYTKDYVLRVRLAEIMQDRGIDSYAEVSRRTGIFVTVVTRLAKGETRGIEFDTLMRLCIGLGVTPNALFEIDVRSEDDAPVRDIDDKRRVVERRLDDVFGINPKNAQTPSAE